MFDYNIINDDFLKFNIKLIEDFMKCEYLNYILKGIKKDEPRIMKLELSIYLKKLDNLKYGDREYYLLNLKKLLKLYKIELIKVMDKNSKRVKNINNIELKFNYDCSLNIVSVIILLEEVEDIRLDDNIVLSPVFYLGSFISAIFEYLVISKYFERFVNNNGKHNYTIKERFKVQHNTHGIMCYGKCIREILYKLNTLIIHHYKYDIWEFVFTNLRIAHNIPIEKINQFDKKLEQHVDKRYINFLMDIKDSKYE